MPDSAEKARRQRAILQLVRRKPIASQDALVRELDHRGIEVTQSTLSRDLKELRVSRAPTEDGYRYLPVDADERPVTRLPGARRLGSLTGVEVTGVDANEAMIVVRTLTGRAQGVGVYIDSLRLPELLGTIAGDDTVLVIPRTVSRTERLKKQLVEVLGGQ